jgi:hypothetical protein
MADQPAEGVEDDWDWREFNQWCKQRHRDHVARNLKDYEKYKAYLRESLGAVETAQGAGFRYTWEGRLKIDFWPQSGKWTHVGTNRYNQGPKKMLRYIKEHLHIVQTTKPTTSQETEFVGDRDPELPPWEV